MYLVLISSLYLAMGISRVYLKLHVNFIKPFTVAGMADHVVSTQNRLLEGLHVFNKNALARKHNTSKHNIYIMDTARIIRFHENQSVSPPRNQRV